MNTNNDISRVVEQLNIKFNPKKLILFGSHAKGNAGSNSDIDLCVITDTADKRKLLTDMYSTIDCERPFDLLLYTPKEWEENVMDKLSFAHVINKQGVVLHG